MHLDGDLPGRPAPLSSVSSPDPLPEHVELPGRRRLRFAPSPTGDLHIGNVRTALFSYCLAGEDGRFLIRIEDTDRERYQPESVPRYLETIAWLGMHWDEGPDRGGPCQPYVESERLTFYQAAAERLVEGGAAYFCFCTRERLEELRAAQRTAYLEMSNKTSAWTGTTAGDQGGHDWTALLRCQWAASSRPAGRAATSVCSRSPVTW